MQPLQRQARIAGLLYLFVVLAGPFLLMYVPDKLFVPGDASATASNILAHQSLFKAHLIIGVVANLLFMGAVLALYQLLQGVNRPLAVLMVSLILIVMPLAFLGAANELATLTLLRDPGFLTAFDKPQRDAVTTLLINFDQAGVYVYEVFWGLWLLPLGVLVYGSGFLPRFLGIWLLINGMGYLILSTTGILWPENYGALFRLATPVLFGEVALMLWLLIAGARIRLPAVA